MSCLCSLNVPLQEQISPSDDEPLVSYRSCSVGEICASNVPDEQSCSYHTGSHSMGEVWNCHSSGTHTEQVCSSSTVSAAVSAKGGALAKEQSEQTGCVGSAYSAIL